MFNIRTKVTALEIIQGINLTGYEAIVTGELIFNKKIDKFIFLKYFNIKKADHLESALKQ
jgi:hypothetical protein